MPHRIGLTFALALFARIGLAAESNPLLSRVHDLENLAVAGDSRQVTDLPLATGHLKLLLATGDAAPVRAGQQIVGLYFRGRGRLQYESAYAVEFPVADLNIRKNTNLEAVKGDRSLSVKGEFQELLWIAPGATFPEMDALPPGRGLAAEFGKERAKSLQRQLALDLAVATIDSPEAAGVWAEVRTGNDTLVYRLDPASAQSESLVAFELLSSRFDPEAVEGFPVVLSEQPIARDGRDPVPPPFVLTDVSYTLNASAGKEATLSVVETVVPVGRARRVLRFEMLNTFIRPSGAGYDTSRYRVKSVRDSARTDLPFHHANDLIVVGLPAEAAPGRPLQLTFEIDGDFLYRPGGDNYWVLGTEPWFPQPGLNGSYYTVRATVRVKKPFVPFAPGVTVSRRAEGEDNVLEVKIDKPVERVVVAAGKYHHSEDTRNGVTVRVAAYALGNTRAVKQLTDLAFGIIDYYQRFLGPFPFPEFNIIEINSYGFGQAPPGTMFITQEAFNPYTFEENRVFSQGVNERFAHEIAHQYWGHVVKMPSLEEQWLSESFSEYCAALFLRDRKDKATHQSLINHWRAKARTAQDASPIPLANRVYLPQDPRTNFAIRTGLIYDKGAYLLATLHKELGDEAFLTFLKSYQKSFEWKFGTTKQVYGLLQAITKKDYQPFFEQYYWGTALPN